MNNELAYSRPRATAVRLGEFAEDRHRFTDKRVLLTGESVVLATKNGQDCFLNSLRLLVRICRNVSILIPEECEILARESRAVAGRVQFDQEVKFLEDEKALDTYDAILSVGCHVRTDLPWTAINSNGWLARVSSGKSNLESCCDQTNTIGALAAACLGVAEVFKRLIHLKSSRGLLLDGLTFSLYSYKVGDSDAGPGLPGSITLDFLLIGAGAIGNGVIYLLNQLPLRGRAWIVDRQAFGDENWGTCLLIGPQDMGIPKASFAVGVLSPKLECKPFPEELTTFLSRVGKEVPYPSVVLNALDNIDARHEMQRGLWPDLIIDGAIGDFACQVSRHPWEGDVACLLCLFRHPAPESAEQVASRATGLSLARAQQAFDVITEADVEVAPDSKKEWLRSRIGQQICSVVREAVAQRISEDQQRKGFEPSVPFVACFSACMMVGELVKFASAAATPLEPRFQFDILTGPAYGQEYPQERRRDCLCVTRRRNIGRFRNSR